MTTSWPNVPLYVGDADYDSFWTHEWSKHGTCASAYTQQGFFEVALATHMSLGTPALITENTGGSVDAGDLMEAFGGDDRSTLLALARRRRAARCHAGDHSPLGVVGGAPRRPRRTARRDGRRRAGPCRGGPSYTALEPLLALEPKWRRLISTNKKLG